MSVKYVKKNLEK